MVTESKNEVVMRVEFDEDAAPDPQIEGFLKGVVGDYETILKFEIHKLGLDSGRFEIVYGVGTSWDGDGLGFSTGITAVEPLMHALVAAREHAGNCGSCPTPNWKLLSV